MSIRPLVGEAVDLAFFGDFVAFFDAFVVGLICVLSGEEMYRKEANVRDNRKYFRTRSIKNKMLRD